MVLAGFPHRPVFVDNPEDVGPQATHQRFQPHGFSLPSALSSVATDRAMTLQHLAVSGYRSLQSVVLPLRQLTLITGANGSGKSNLFRSLHLIVAAARGDLVAALAREGGLPAVLWAGPERLSRGMRSGEQPVQGGPR